MVSSVEVPSAPYVWSVVWRFEPPPVPCTYLMMCIPGPSEEPRDVHYWCSMQLQIHTRSRKHLPTSSGQSMQLSSSRRNILYGEVASGAVNTAESSRDPGQSHHSVAVTPTWPGGLQQPTPIPGSSVPTGQQSPFTSGPGGHTKLEAILLVEG